MLLYIVLFFLPVLILTHQPVSSFNIYLVKLLPVPNIVGFLVLKVKPEDIFDSNLWISALKCFLISEITVNESYRFGLEPHVNEVPFVFAVPFARVGGGVLWVWSSFWCHVHPPSPQNHLKNGIIVFTGLWRSLEMVFTKLNKLPRI